MAVIYNSAVQSGRMMAVRDAIDSGGVAGRLEICSANYATVLATVLLGYPGNSTATINGSTMTLAGFPRSDGAIDASGVAAVARIRNSAGLDVATGLSVGTANADIVLTNLTLIAGGTLTISAATLTHGNAATVVYPPGVDATTDPPITDGNLTAFAAAINLAATPANRWIDTGIGPGTAWAIRSMIVGARDATQAEVEPGPADVGAFSSPAEDTLVNSCGAAWFPAKNQFVWFGGGHAGWPGNEVYWTDLPTMAWGRMTDPSPMERDPTAPSGYGWRNTDGTIRTYHTYNGIVAKPDEDAFYTLTSSPWPDGGFPDADIWKFHIPTKAWSLEKTNVFAPLNTFRGVEMHWVESEGKFAIGQPNFWRWYDPVTKVLGTQLTSQSTMANGNSVATPTGIYTFGSNGSCHYLPYANIGISASTSVNTTTHPRIRSHPRWLDAGHQWNSYLWDTTRNMVIAWSGSYTSEPTTSRTGVGRFVYGIDFANDHLYEFVLSGGSWATSQSLGTFTKWQHIVSLDCYVGLNNRAKTNGWMVFKPGAMTQLT